MQYGPDTWRNTPEYKFMTGQINEAEYNRLTNQSSPVAALGIDLMGPGQIDPARYAMLAQNPDARALLESMWAAGNRNINTEAGLLGYWASGGAATPYSMIRT